MVSAQCVTIDVGDTKWQQTGDDFGYSNGLHHTDNMRELHRITKPCNVTIHIPSSQDQFGLVGVVSFTFVCTLVYLDHTVVLVQLDVRSRKGLNCYVLSVNLLEHTGNQVSTLEACIFNLRTQYRANYSSRCATSLDSKICYCSSTTNHPADYFVDKTQITILDFTFQNSNSQHTGNWRLQYRH